MSEHRYCVDSSIYGQNMFIGMAAISDVKNGDSGGRVHLCRKSFRYTLTQNIELCLIASDKSFPTIAAICTFDVIQWSTLIQKFHV